MTFSKLKPCVEYVLKNYPETTIDDFKLIYYTYYHLGFLNKNKSFKTVMLEAKKNTYNAFESITRVRREILNEFPELQDLKTQQLRKLKEQKTRQYYINKKKIGDKE